MSWLDEELEHVEELRHSSETPSDAQVYSAVRAWWQWFGEALKRNAEEARRHEISAEFSQSATGHYRLANREAGLAADFALDEQIRSVRFDYSSSHPGTPAPEAAPASAPAIAGAAPEGGVLTLRPRGAARVAPFLSDQHLHEQELMRTLLKPVLFPDAPSTE
ncbi:MAG: hypothetical protein JO041_13930 [Acidobacteria bacterium]|nr:hypothetical protein [Acidobacteriota bacterium]